MAGFHSVRAKTDDEAEMLALNIALQVVVNEGLHVRHLLVNNLEICKTSNLNHQPSCWRMNSWILSINQLLIMVGSPNTYIIPKNWASPALKLALHDVN